MPKFGIYVGSSTIYTHTYVYIWPQFWFVSHPVPTSVAGSAHVSNLPVLVEMSLTAQLIPNHACSYNANVLNMHAIKFPISLASIIFTGCLSSECISLNQALKH